MLVSEAGGPRDAGGGRVHGASRLDGRGDGGGGGRIAPAIPPGGGTAAQMGRGEIQKIVTAKKSELGVSDKKDAGKLMAAVMKELKGKADGGDVKAAVDASFS